LAGFSSLAAFLDFVERQQAMAAAGKIGSVELAGVALGQAED
jgi:hypothetical protein